MILADAAAIPPDATTLGVIAVAVIALREALQWARERIDKMSEEKRANRDEAAGKVSPEVAIAAAIGQKLDHEGRIRAMELELAEGRGRRQRMTGSHQRIEADE